MTSSHEILTEDDFYTHFKPFAIWLVKKKQVTFESISNNKSKKMFRSFIKRWNANSLKPIYYDVDSLLNKYGHLIQTTHNWNLKLSQKDSQVLNSCLDEIHELNKFETKPKEKIIEQPKEPAPAPKIIGPRAPPTIMKGVITQNENERILAAEAEREMKKTNIKLMKKKEKRDAEDLSPKKIGREKEIEKKRTINKMLNGEKDNDVEAETYEDNPGNSFQMAKRREVVRLQRKEMKIQEKREILNEKIKKYEESESLKVKKLLESLGLEKKFKM